MLLNNAFRSNNLMHRTLWTSSSTAAPTQTWVTPPPRAGWSEGSKRAAAAARPAAAGRVQGRMQLGCLRTCGCQLGPIAHCDRSMFLSFDWRPRASASCASPLYPSEMNAPTALIFPSH